MEIDGVSPPPAIVFRSVGRGEIEGEAAFALLPTPGLAVGRVVALVDDVLVYADHRTIAHAYLVLGILTEETTAGVAPHIRRKGILSLPSWDWGAGLDLLFIGEAGQLTPTPPVTGFLMPFASVISPSKINIEIGSPWLYG